MERKPNSLTQGESPMDKKRAHWFCKFLDVEMRKIDEDKFFEGCRRQCDPGSAFVIDWIKRNAESWRNEWNHSKCQHCNHWKVCGHLVKEECESFEIDILELEESNSDD